MNVRILQHVPFEGIGSIQAWMDRHHATVTTTRLFKGDAVPGPEAFDWLIVMGGPMSVNDEHVHGWLAPEKRAIAAAIEARKPVLGICLGAQLIASALASTVYPNGKKEIGWFPVRRADGADSPLARIFRGSPLVFHWHGDTFDLPTGAVRFLESNACSNQAFELWENVVGLQFHLETTPESARALIDNSREEIVPSPTIQTEQEMLREPARFAAVNRLMDAVLDYLAPA
ncbi:MAG TPA: gamma-glutamyl-gamma-aminobutyrate hydrolase family protein [Spirochaetia bacterium]|nr:gamma-glutamyl-gamma-aminobutyrate hydrolase family protein [Spirochaetia bacterium]